MLRSLAVAALFASLGCGAQSGGDARRVIVGEPSLVVVVPAIERLRAASVAFLAGVEGTSGVLELARGRYGVDLGSREGLLKAGLDPAASLVAFEREGGLVVAAGVSDDEAFISLVTDRLRRGAGGRPPNNVEEGVTLSQMEGPVGAGGSPRWRAAWGVTEDHIGVFALSPGDGEPLALWRAAAAGRGEYLDKDAPKRARERAGQGAALWFVGGDIVPEAPARLGLMRGMVSGVLDGLREVFGGLTLTGDRLSLRLSLASSGERELPVAWVRPEGPSDVFAEVFPKTTTALLRLRLNTAKLRRYPSILRKRFLPSRIPGTRGMPLPELSDLLDFTDGDFAIALLGVDPSVTVQRLINMQRRGAGFGGAFHLALAARLRDPRAARAAFGAIGTQLRTSGWTVAAVSGGGLSGWTFQRGESSYSVLLTEDVLVFLTGKGEVAPFLAVGEERALPIRALAEGEPVAGGALGLTPKSAGLVLSFTRVTRELADKGVPPYFLKIVNDIRVIAATVDMSERRIDLDVDMAL